MSNYFTWVCVDCGHMTLSVTRPMIQVWSDGHTCNMEIPDARERAEYDRLKAKGVIKTNK